MLWQNPSQSSSKGLQNLGRSSLTGTGQCIPVYETLKEDPGNYRCVSSTLEHGNILEKIMLLAVERHLKNDYQI